MNRAALDALADEQVDWRHKGMPPALWGMTVEQIRARRPRLSELPTPLLTLSRAALDHNIDALASWCATRGFDLAPHGKTTMAPVLWAEQLRAGAWAITLANLPQLAIARAFGVQRVMIANSVISPLSLRWIVDELAAHPDDEIYVWADAVDTVRLMHEAIANHVADVGDRPQLRVLVERGGAGGRTGARDLGTALEIAAAVADSPYLALAGVAGYEGALAHTADEQSREIVAAYLRDLAEVHERLAAAGLYPEGITPVVTAGGSAYFDVVDEVLRPLAGAGARVVLRSGAYVVHDDGFYRDISPLGEHPRTDGPALRSAMHGWVRVSSQPEPGMAIFDAGKRDLPFDEGLPEVQRLRPRTADEHVTDLDGVSVTALNDQHGFLRFDAQAEPPVQIGDELRLGLSHPCTAMDKWTLVPVIGDADEDDPVVVDLLRTWF
ncbi:MAG TPA: amino acid deaminase [Flexivirga sp.]|uniref:amino acid deaminase n=1 Tax=Flexivirga sp. TaxID=1962927 RepID=UPI002B670168|nr:amino acid deaminase [Flexivirga sp.]HWC22591.1 amino acid deaminase [Flexivirga sp.]